MDKLLLSLVSAIVGAYVSYLITSRRNRTDTIFNLHSEFHSDAFLKTRDIAYSCIKIFPDTRFDNLTDQCQEQELARSMWVQVGFYQRLWVSIKHKRVDKRLVPELFGELFLWWYEVAFSTNLIPLERESGSELAELHEWMKEATLPEKFDKWQSKGKDGRNKLISNGKS